MSAAHKVMDEHAYSMVFPFTCMSGYREWVNVIRFEVTKTVVDETVRAFIRVHGVKDIVMISGRRQ